MDPKVLRWLLSVDDIGCLMMFRDQFTQFVSMADKMYPHNKLGMASMGTIYSKAIFAGFNRVQPA